MYPITLFLLSCLPFTFTEPLTRTCEPIHVDLCQGLGYNLTGMPNLGGNDLQQEAEYTLKSFLPLIQYGCSSQLKLFLCSVYVPMCTEKVANPIGPCRGLCESVMSRCYPVLKGFGFPWPDVLNCSRFPVENNHEHMCMEGPKDKGIDITAPVDPAVRKLDWALKNGKELEDLRCEGETMFDDSEKKFAEVWVTVWAFICFLTSTSAALTLMIGGGRVKARPLISIALCYCLVSVGWALRIITGRISRCQEENLILDEASEDGLSNVKCAFVFLLVYYFGMAANAWWVGLCAWWVARVGLSWSPEKMRNTVSALHVCSWGLPAVQTVAALVIRDVDSNQLTGTCYIGNRNTTTLLALVLLPNVIYLCLGIVLLIFGCIYVIRKPRPSAAAPLTAAAPRKESDFLGALCTVYAIPLLCVSACVYYQYNNTQRWLANEGKPAFFVFLLQYLMSFFVGVSSVFWIWSKKTLAVWKGALRRLGPQKQLPLKVQTMPVMRYPPQSIGTSQISSASRGSVRMHSVHRSKRVHHHPRTGGQTVI